MPAAFALSDWNVTRAGPGQARIDIFARPTHYGLPIDAIEYRIGGGVWTALPTHGRGSYPIAGVTDATALNIEICAKCANISSAPSDTKSVPATTVAVTVPNQTANWGAKTVQNGGCFRPIDSLGQPVNLTASPSPVLVSGSLGSYVPTITTTGPGTGLTFNSGGVGGPNGAVVRVALATGGTVDLTIATVANEFHVASLQQASTAYGNAVLGDTIRLRAGDHNLAMAAIVIARGTSPSGTWTGGSDLRAGNWVTLTRDGVHPVRIGQVNIGNFDGHARYLRVHDLDFLSTQNGNVNGGGSGGSGQLVLYSNGSSTATMAATDIRCRHSTTVTGETIAYVGINTGPYNGIYCVGGPFWFENITIEGAFAGINANSYNSTTPPLARNILVRRAQVDGVLWGQCSRMVAENIWVTDKLWPHTALTVTGITPGTSTVFTVASTSQVIDGTLVTLTGFTGAYAALNGRSETLTSKTGTTLTLPINTTGLTWDSGAGSTLRSAAANHGDLMQWTENNGAAANQIDVILRGIRLSRGYADGHWQPEGQGMFAGNSGTTSDRTGWLIEYCIIETTLLRGISISNLKNSTIQSCVVVMPLGLDGKSGGVAPAIIIENGANNIYRDNIAHQYLLDSTPAVNTNNAVVTISNTEAIPAHGPNVSAYALAYVAAPSAPDTIYDPVEAYATRTATGGQFDGFARLPGATPYFDFATFTILESMMAYQFSTAVRNASLDAIETAIGTAPTLTIRTGAPPANCAAARTGTVLATIVLPSDWMAAASAGAKAILGGPWQDASADATGTAGHFSIDQGATCHIQGTCSGIGGGGDMVIDNPALVATQSFQVTAFTINAGGA